jgi:phage-related protein
MPKTAVRIYKEKGGSVPLRDWLDGLPAKIQDKCIARVELLAEYGHQLRRPVCDYLDNGIYELRVRYNNVNYRILYCFVGKDIVLLSHGCTKEQKVPRIEIERAVRNRADYLRNPAAHTYEEAL